MIPHVRELPSPDDSKHYLALVKQLLEEYKSCRNSDVETKTLQSLVKTYLDIPARIPAKRVIASFFQNLELELQSRVETSICEQLSRRLLIGTAAGGSLVTTRHTVDTIAALMENFKLGELCMISIAAQAMRFLAEAQEHFLSQANDGVPPVHLNELMHHCHVSVQTLSLLLQKIVVGCADLTNQIVADSQLLTFIMDLNLQILHNEVFLLDCRCCCAMNAFILLQLALTDQEAAEKIPAIVLPEKNAGHLPASWLTREQAELLSVDTASTLSSLAVMFGYIATVRSSSIVQQSPCGQLFYLDSLLPCLLSHGIKCADTMSKTLFGKTVHLWTSKLMNTVEAAACPPSLTGKCLGRSSVLYTLLEYVWTHSDDQLDVVRQSSKSVFENILQIHSHLNSSVANSNSLDEFTEFILTQLFSMSWTSRGKFTALTCVVRLIGAQVMVGRRPELPVEILMQLQQQALSCYASELYTMLFTSHRQELSLPSKEDQEDSCRTLLNTTWLEPVLAALCSSNKKLKQNIIEYLLCKLMKSDHQLLAFFIQRLSAARSDEAEPNHGAIIMCLRRAQLLGLLRPAPSAGDNLWYGHLQPDVLRAALCSSDEQIRLDAFALLCDNYKTTEVVTDFEFSMLKFFIPCNVSNQSPSFRQSFLSLLNKLFFRLKESLAALRRRAKKVKQTDFLRKSGMQYENFLSWLTKYMLGNLYPGSAFARRTISLAVISLMSTYFMRGDDGFSVPEQLTRHHMQTLLECLADTFEENKREAVKVCTAYLAHRGCIWDNCGLQDVMRVSLILACSTRPQDCSTAAYSFLLVLAQFQLHPAQCQLPDIIPAEVLLPTSRLMHLHEKTSPLMLENILLSLLDSQISVASQSLVTAAATRPMYPTLHCIRYILQDMTFIKLPLEMLPAARKFIQQLIASCLNLSRVVSPVVQNSSPEGNVPEALLGPGLNIGNILEPSQPVSDVHWAEFEQQTADLSEVASLSRALVESVPEYLIVCCWRSIKEVSLTLGNMCLQIPPAQMAEVATDSTLLSLEQVKVIGEYFISQLLESIHRGAFELAYAGFQSMCQMLWNHHLTCFHHLPAQWLSGVIENIKSDDPDSKLCSTRRSAGVPFFVQAVTSTEPATAGRKCFHGVMKELLVLALSPPGADTKDCRLESNQTQVHALNILRALYRDARLSEEVAPYVADGLKASVLGFKSEQWAVQNSATLLLSALMTRMFGVKRSKDESNMSKKNCQTGRAFFHHYPSLYPFLLSELEEATADMGSKSRIHIRPSLYPVLLVLGRLFPSTLEGSDTSLNLSAFIPYVIRCAASPVYKTRVIASRALQPLVGRNQVISICCQLLERLPEAGASENVLSSQVHGLLLQLCQLAKLIKDMAESIQDEIFGSILSSLSRRTWLMSSHNPCCATRQAALLLTDAVLDIAVTVGHRFPGHAKAIHELKVIFWSALLRDSQASEHVWQPLYFDLERTRARLCLKHAADATSSATCRDDCATELGDSSEKSFFKCLHAADMSCSTSQIVLKDVLVKLLGSPLYEVRLEVLDVLWTLWGTSGVREDLVSSSSQLGDVDACSSIVETERLDIGLSNAALEQLSSALFDHILKMSLETETHHECLQKLFRVLISINSSSRFLSKKGSQEILEMFSHLKTKIEIERRIEVKAAMLRFTGGLVPFVYSQSSGGPQALRRWIQLVKSSSSTDENPLLQISCCLVLQENAQILFCDPDHKLGNTVYLTWDSLAILLQEDDLEVKELAASVLCLVSGLRPGSCHPSYALDVLPVSLVSVHADRDLPGVASCLLQWILSADGFDIQDCSQRLFDKGEMNVYRDPVSFTRCIASALAALFDLDLGSQVCSLGIMADISVVAHTHVAHTDVAHSDAAQTDVILAHTDVSHSDLVLAHTDVADSDVAHTNVAHTDVAQCQLTPGGDQPVPRFTSDRHMTACMKNEHFLQFALQALSSLTNHLRLLLCSCQRSDVYMNSGRYMTLCQTVYKAKVVLFLFMKHISNYNLDTQQNCQLLENMVCQVTDQFQLSNTLIHSC